MPNATILDGKAVADRRLTALAKRVANAHPGLGIVLATDDPATTTYVDQKRRHGAAAGFQVAVNDLGPASTLDDIKAACAGFNTDPKISGYIVQLPLPDWVDVDTALASVDPTKDADGLTPVNLDLLYDGRAVVVPATPRGILTLLEEYGIKITGHQVTVVGQGRLTGRPLAALLEQREAIVTRADDTTTDLAAATRDAEILVVATGQPGLITAGMVKPGATVIDVGINQVGGKTVGDVDYQEVSKVAGAITPVPGGIGPMTVVSLLENVAELAQRQVG